MTREEYMQWAYPHLMSPTEDRATTMDLEQAIGTLNINITITMTDASGSPCMGCTIRHCSPSCTYR